MEKVEYGKMFAFENTYWWYRGLHGLVEWQIKSFFKRAKHQITIFDAGCGTGRMMEIACRYGCVEGVDYEPEAVEFCKKRGLSNVQLLDLNTWQPQPQRFDIIISLDVLGHQAIISENEIVDKFFISLKKDGIVILNLPAFEFLRRKHDSAVHTRKRYRTNEVTTMLQSSGFTVTKATYRLFFLFFIMLTKKFVEKRSKASQINSDLMYISKWLNNALYIINQVENFFLRLSFFIPFGGSVFIVAKK